MNFDVWWIPAAEDQLAEIWMAAADRNAVTLAADRIDTALAADPLGVGESRPDRYRVLIEMPLVSTTRSANPIGVCECYE